MKCPNCNETNYEPTAKFCHVCGMSLTNVVDLVFTRTLSRRQATKYIIIHHSGVKSPHSLEDVHRWHQQIRGWAGVGYHFFIDKKGKVYRGRPVDTVGVHARDYDQISIGVCFEGDFSQELMKSCQVSDEAIELLVLLKGVYGAPIVFCDELKGWKNSPIEGFKRMEIKNKLSNYFVSSNKNLVQRFNGADTPELYEWVDLECRRFGISSPINM